MIVVSDKVLEYIDIESAASVVHYDIPNVQNKFSSRLLTMKSLFYHHCLQNRVSPVSEIIIIIIIIIIMVASILTF